MDTNLQHGPDGDGRSDDGRLRVAVATPLSEEFCALVERLEPRVMMVRDQSLLPPMRRAGDHSGDPNFRRTPEQQTAFEELVDSADALYGIPDEKAPELTRTVRANPRLRWVHTMAAGGGAAVKAALLTEDDLTRVAFSTSAGVHSGTLAEFAVFGVLAGAKDLPRLQRQQRAKEWSERWCMRQIDEMTVVVVGLGSIGAACAAKFSALGATVLGVNRSIKQVDGVAEVVTADRIGEVVGRADAIVVTVPGTDSTLKMLSAEVLAQVKPGVIVVNVGRGTAIDEPALIDALTDGRVSFAALDVFFSEPLSADSPLWDLDNVLVSPHTAALNEAEDRRIAELFAANATRLLDGEELLNRVDTVDFY